ncbi:MAG TPA: AAA family ATPase [Acidimicrobiales bacterium]|nr:AAA family ATPase [Acidimicrobiales bacterium]
MSSVNGSAPPTAEVSEPPPAEAVQTAVVQTAPVVLVHDQRGALWSKVDAVAATLAPRPVVLRSADLGELGRLLTEQHVDVLVAGPGLDNRSGIERLRIIRDELPRLVTVLAVDRPDHHDAATVVRAGAVDLVQSTIDEERLAATINRAASLALRIVDPAPSAAEPLPAPPPERPQRVITVASASGGCGKTFLATNLAWFLTHKGGRRVCILDLDLQFGEVTAALQLRPRYTITDLIQHGDEPQSELDAHIEEFCEQDETGVWVLAAPRDPTEAAMIQPEDIGRVIDAAARHFDDVIIDTPPMLGDAVLTAFHRSDELFVLATLDIPSVRNMRVFLDTLDRLNVRTDAVRLFLNKAEDDAGMEVRQIDDLFPRGFDGTLPYSRDVQRSLNAGLPVMAHRPGSAISHRLGDATKRLLDPSQRQAYEAERSEPRSSGRWWRGRSHEAAAS